MRDGETTDAWADAITYFIAAAAFFVLGNVDRLRSVSLGGAGVWPRTDELFAALEVG